MNLLTYLEQAHRARNSLPKGTDGPVADVAYLVGPCDVAKWAQDNKGECSRGDKNTELVAQMFKSVVGDKLKNDFRLKFQGTGVFANPYLSSATLAEALWTCKESEPALYYLDDVKKAIRAIVGFGVNMTEWAWPACRHYHTITSSEAKDGFTMDFSTKHLNANEDIRGAKNIADLRGKEQDERQGIKAFGSIVTSRSGGIVKKEISAFSKEILGRNKEFTATHEALADYFKSNVGDFGGGSKAKFGYIDSVTFTTQNKYTMFEFESGKGAEVACFIRFSVSCDASGDKWAVHHLASTAATRPPTTGTLLSTNGINVGDPTTTAKFG